MLKDFLTGREIADVGAETHRQTLERYLVEIKGYTPEDVIVDAPLEIEVAGEPYRSRIDLLVLAGQPPRAFMAIKCAAGSLGSREREIVSAGRIYGKYQIPLAVVSDGRNAIVLNTVTGRKIAEGLAAIPDRRTAMRQIERTQPQAYPRERLEREKLIFRSYDRLNVNVNRP